MVRSTREYQSVLLCVYPDVDLIKSCNPDDAMFSTEDTMDQDEAMNECQHLGDDMNLDTDADWTQILDNQPIVLNDRMMTDAVQSPHIQSEHSYSLTLNDEMPQSPFGHNIKLEDYGKGVDHEIFRKPQLIFKLNIIITEDYLRAHHIISKKDENNSCFLNS